MTGFKQHTGIAVPLMQDNIDTDQIIPSREMKRVSKKGLADGLFSGQRYLYAGDTRTGLNPQFALNSATHRGATVLLSGSNFGCGSSREHAVWALQEYGFVAVIAQSFGEIFRNNALRNGLLPIALSADAIGQLLDATQAAPAAHPLLIDIVKCQVSPPAGAPHPFVLEDYYRDMLLNGRDFIDLAQEHSAGLDAFKAADRHLRPWAYLADTSNSAS